MDSTSETNFATPQEKQKGSRKIVKLNVGGMSFKTLEVTLAPSKYFTNLLDETLMPNNKKVNGDEIFIDRPGKLFSHILYYLRTSKVMCRNKKTLESLYLEAQFYQIEELADYCKGLVSAFSSSCKDVQVVDTKEMFGTHDLKDVDSQPWYYLIKKTKSTTEKFALVDCVFSCYDRYNPAGYLSKVLLLPLDD